MPASAGTVLVVPSVAPAAGWWWTPDEPGRGIVLEQMRPDELFVGVLLYATDGTPIWHTVDAKASGETWVGDLEVFSGGQTLDGLYKPSSLAGTAGKATFTFDSPTSGWLSWPGGTHRIQRYDITAGYPTNPGLNLGGTWWFNGAEPGRGFFTEIRQNVLFLLGAVYDDLGRPVWYTAQGPMTTTSMFHGALTRVSGGQTLEGEHHPPASVASLGLVSIQFGDDNNAVVTAPSGRQIPLVRYGLCLEVQRLARTDGAPAGASPAIVPGFPWPGCGGQPVALQ